jgi:hypothetical protein
MKLPNLRYSLLCGTVLATTILLSCMNHLSFKDNAPTSAQNLKLVARLDRNMATPSQGVSISMVLENIGRQPVAICRCFGVRKGWFYLEFTDAAGKPLPIQGPEYDLFENAPYECVKPGRSLSITKNLWHWYPDFGGSVDKGLDADRFNLAPGYYHVRAVYLDNGSRIRRCHGFSGSIASEWLDFEVLP